MPPYDHWLQAKKVCVIGPGTMGGGIAAHLANLGFDVTLLGPDREQTELGAERLRNARPPHFYVPERAQEIRYGTVEGDADAIREADWVCEAIVEDLEIKRALFRQIAPLIAPDAMVSTNTSGLQIGLLAEGLPDGFVSRFLGTHFFNPPRYLKLLELIPTERTDPAAVRAMTRFLEERAGRRVVPAKDTPGFIANRFGMWAMFHAVHTAEKLHLSIEQVDAVTGPFLGRPKSASFRLNDLVGLDVMAMIAQNLRERCAGDPHLGTLETPKSLATLLERGWIGEKAKQGYYRREGRELLALDLNTLAYRDRLEPSFAGLDELAKMPLGERVRLALERRDEAGEFLREHLVPVLRYANYLKEEISHSVLDFDRVMQWGFGWEMGPFAMIDAIGPSALGLGPVRFYQPGEVLSFAGGFQALPSEPEFRKLADFQVVESLPTFQVRDLGDGVLAVGSTTKMGVVTTGFVADLTSWIGQRNPERLVLAGEGRAFSVGFDLRFFLAAIEAEDYDAIDRELSALCHLGELLERRTTVAAVHGYCLGAGTELALSCAVIAADAEAQIGLPEAKVGLLPGGRGTVLARLENQTTMKRLAEVAMNVSTGAVGVSADHARQLGYLRATDVTVFHPDRLMHEARKLALETKPRPLPAWATVEGPLSGMIDRLQEEAKGRGEMTAHDEVIADKIRAVFAKSSSVEDALAKERAGFLDLCRRALTRARIAHMVETNKPLRN